MPAAPRSATPAEPRGPTAARAAALLGGERVLRRPVADPLSAHLAVSRGLPAAALAHLVRGSAALRDPGLIEQALGMSPRTLLRYRSSPRRTLSPEQSGRVWRYAEIVAKAAGVFGGRDRAEAWLLRPALGLDGERPVALLSSPSGARLVEDFLERLEGGAYT